MTMEPEEKMGDFYPSNLLRRVMQWWWVIALLIVAGGICGLLISRIQRPVYESNAVITTVIDFAYAGRLNDYSEDFLITAIGDVIDSTKVMEKVISDASAAGIVLDEQSILEGLTKSRQGYRWELSSRFRDPALAQQINQIWLSAAVDALEELRLTGIEGLDRLALQHAVESCFSQAVVLEPASPYCNAQDLEKIRSAIETDTETDTDIHLLRQLLLSKVSFEVTQDSSLPGTPVLFKANLTTLAGCMAGLILALIIFLSGYPKLRHQGK